MSTPIPLRRDGERWIPALDTFGARLALIRHYMGWNVKEAAEACGFPEANWRGWEQLGRTPRNISDVAARVSEITEGVDEFWLATGRAMPVVTTKARPLAPRGGGSTRPGPVMFAPPLGLEPRTYRLTASGLPTADFRRPLRAVQPRPVEPLFPRAQGRRGRATARA